MKTVSVIFTALIFAIIGGSVFYYKYNYLQFPTKPDKTFNSWYIEAKFELSPQKTWGEKPAILRFKLPSDTNKLAIVDEKFIAKNYGREKTKDADGNRVIEFTKRNLGNREIIFYRAIAYQLESSVSSDKVSKPPLDSPYSKRNRPSIIDEADEPIYGAIDSILEEARQKSADNPSFVREISQIAQQVNNERIAILMDKFTDTVKTTPELTSLLVNAAEIPARVVNGIELGTEARRAQFTQWIDVYIEGDWKPFDAEKAKFGLPKNFLPWWTGNDKKFYESRGISKTDLSISVRKNTDNSLTRAIWKSENAAKFFHKFSFYNLPIESQLVFKILLMIPVGGLVIAFLRQIIGLKTFGTFMPVLVAISFKDTGLLNGIVFFTSVVVIGMMLRSYFHHLQLLLVPRLAAVLTLVVLIISIIGMIAHDLSLDIGLSIALFPIVILTMTIERMTVMWDETSAKDAIITGIGSLIAASVGYLFMNNDLIKHLIFTFPELLLMNLALCMLLGRYNGYKLTEYFRFRKLNRAIEAKKTAGNNKKTG